MRKFGNAEEDGAAEEELNEKVLWKVFSGRLGCPVKHRREAQCYAHVWPQARVTRLVKARIPCSHALWYTVRY